MRPNGNGAGDVLQSKGSQWVPQRHKYQRKFGLGYNLCEVVPWRHNSEQRRRPSGLPLALLRDWNIVLKLNTLDQVRYAWYTASERPGAHLSSSLGWEPNGRHKWFPSVGQPFNWERMALLERLSRKNPVVSPGSHQAWKLRTATWNQFALPCSPHFKKLNAYDTLSELCSVLITCRSI